MPNWRKSAIECSHALGAGKDPNRLGVALSNHSLLLTSLRMKSTLPPVCRGRFPSAPPSCDLRMIVLLDEGSLARVCARGRLQFLGALFGTSDLVRPKLSFQRGKVGLSAPISGNRCGEDPCIGRLQIFPCRTP